MFRSLRLQCAPYSWNKIARGLREGLEPWATASTGKYKTHIDWDKAPIKETIYTGQKYHSSRAILRTLLFTVVSNCSIAGRYRETKIQNTTYCTAPWKKKEKKVLFGHFPKTRTEATLIFRATIIQPSCHKKLMLSQIYSQTININGKVFPKLFLIYIDSPFLFITVSQFPFFLLRPSLLG